MRAFGLALGVCLLAVTGMAQFDPDPPVRDEESP